MGTSTDAILIYGVMLSDFDEEQYEELPFAGEEDDDFDDFILRRAGVPTYGQEGHCFKKSREAVEKFPLTLVSHCSGEYPMWILGIKETYKRASRGHPVTLNGSLPTIPNDGVLVLQAFCEEFGIEFVPDWILCSDWG